MNDGTRFGFLVGGLIAGVAVTLAVVLLRPDWFGPGGDADGPGGNGSGSGVDGEREVLYWEAPMDPSYRRDEPGKSPMGMDLVPVYADQGGAPAGTVEIDPRVVNQLGVETAVAEHRTLSREVRTVGTVTYNERRVSHVHTRVNGWVERLHVDAEGDRVEAGEPILEIYSPELLSAQEEYLIALRRAGRASGNAGGVDMVALARERLTLLGVSRSEIERVERTGEIRSRMTLRAPHTGVVTQLGVRDGMRVTPEDNLYDVADLSSVWVLADVYAYQADWVAPGDPVSLKLPFHPGREWRGEVEFVYPYLNEATRTVRARLVFDNPDGRLKPNMYATAVIEADPRAGVLAVPERAVIDTGGSQRVILAEGEGRFRPRAVRAGFSSGGWTAIEDGLATGDRVVTSAQFLLDAEADFESAMARMQGPADEGGAERAMATGSHDHDHDHREGEQ